MRKVLMVLLCSLSIIARATDYYVSSSGNNSANGLTSSTPWQSILKVNSVFSTLNPGDRILFKRGERFYGALQISRSGSSGSPITLVPLDATDYVTVTTDFYQRQMKERLTPSAEFVYRIIMKKEPNIRLGEFHFWDPLAAVILTDESQASYQELSLEVVEEEGPTSGQTLVSAEGQPIRVAIRAELPRFEKLFWDTINGTLK
jgi:hypothetical protein